MFYLTQRFEDAVVGPFNSIKAAELWSRTHPDCDDSVYSESVINWNLKPRKIKPPKFAR
jgi:hypothetical protein